MRICYLTNSGIPSTSANSIATVKMCEAFSELKNEVILITRNVKNNNKDIFKFYDVKFKFKFKIRDIRSKVLNFKYGNVKFSTFKKDETLKLFEILKELNPKYNDLSIDFLKKDIIQIKNND